MTVFTTAQKLFKKYYRCRIPGYVIGEYEMNRYGYRRSGSDPSEDAMMSERDVEIRATVLVDDNKRNTTPSICEMVASGTPVILSDPKDAVDIYRVVRDHLNDWNKYLNEAIVLPGTKEEQEAVIADLIKLDKLQVHISRMASLYIKEEPGSIFSSMLTRNNKANNLRRNKVERKEVNDVKHKSMAIDFKKGLRARRKRNL